MTNISPPPERPNLLATGVPPEMDGGKSHAPRRGGFQPIRDLPALIWLILLFAAALFHRELPVAGWLLLHLLFLGAITHSILVWSQHFSLALSRLPQTPRERITQNTRLVLANSAAVLVLVGVTTAKWALTLTGSTLLIVAVLWHGLSIFHRSRRALPGRFTRSLHYYIVSAALLAIGAGLGGWIAEPSASPTGIVLAHAIINVLGWIGITVAGTLVTLWPTMLRTRADEHAAQDAARALPVLAGAVTLAALGAGFGVLPLIAFGLASYAIGLLIIAVSLFRAAHATPPRSFATLSTAAAFAWLIACIVILAAQTLDAWVSDTGVTALRQAMHDVAPFLAAGFATQVLIGALSYLTPVVLGGGPSPARIGTAMLDRYGVLRVATANSALFVCLLPMPSLIRVAASALYLVAVASFLLFFVLALIAQSRAKREGVRLNDPLRRGPIVPKGVQPSGKRAGQAVAGLLAVLLLTAAFGAVNPNTLGGSGRPYIAAPAENAETTSDSNAPVQTVQVTAADMRFTPNRIEVPAGTRLVIELHNTDGSQVHDLVLANGVSSQRLSPGASASLDVGIITADIAGWCSIVGHRQMGMTLDIVVVGDVAASDDQGTSGGSHTGSHGDAHGGNGSAGSTSTGAPSAAELIDHAAEPGAGFTPHDAGLDPLPATAGPVTHQVTLPVSEFVAEVAPGVRQRLWTFGGSAPGPLLHGRVGDTFEITLVNDGTIGHSIDFHAGALAPDQPMRTIAPSETLTYTFTATRSGIWLYHCSTMPMSAHIANGMYGAVIIEGADLPTVDRSYVLVQGEYYLGPQDGEVDVDRLATAQPDLTVFNGYAAQYAFAPLTARVGERVRIWVLDAGPNRASSFHVIGGQFDTVWSEGRYLINRAVDTGSQALALLPAQGGFVELIFPEAGNYPFVSHIMVDAERGARGIFHVTE